jgi:sulfatase maturation enzyme AslB (radical SAM superfamily)
MASTRLLRSLEKHVSLDKVMRLKNEKLGGNVLGRLSIWKMVRDAVWTGGPGTCHFAITSACNARCGFCSFARDQLPAASRHSVTLAEAKLASDILKRNGVRFLHFTGGEPLVHRDFMAMVSHAAQIGMIPTLVTNGALLTPKRVDALADAGLATVYISIDAASSTVHDSNRGLTGLSARIRRANVALKRRQIPSSASVTMSRLVDYSVLPEFLRDLGFGAVTFSYPLRTLPSSYLACANRRSSTSRSKSCTHLVTIGTRK